MKNAFDDMDVFRTYSDEKMLRAANRMISENEDLCEEEFLGVQGILMLNGLI